MRRKPRWRRPSESRPPESRAPGALSFAGQLTAVVRSALSVGAWSTVTSPRTPSSSSTSSSPPGKQPEAGMEQRETPYPDPETPFLEVKVLPGPQELHPGKLEAEDVPAPAGSLTEPAAEPQVPRSKKRPQPPVKPFPARSVTEGEDNQGRAKTAAEIVTAVEDASPARSTAREATKEKKIEGWGLHGLPLPKPPTRAAVQLKPRLVDVNPPPLPPRGSAEHWENKRRIQDAGEEEAGAEGATERLEEPSAGGRDRARVASPGQPDVQYEGEEKSAEFSDAWWIASDRDVLPKFSLFEHELRSHVPFSSSCEVCVRARGLKKARRRTEVHQNEVQLDQFWHGSLRFLILVHSKSFAIGCVSGDGPREAIVAGMSQWLMHFGLANKDCLFTCDAEGYMRTLWQQLLQDFPSF